ncbi:MAG: indolepyruvate ferredoxin oxidoreductase family protein [Ectothiorhodospiraceae bacterium]|nr:indolepyruvate ferredoxin oxidoreductase family protein [Chromatiales bacterium]MCP5153834.1 indolepyruvate ferredoxin oxidoreductase family protein [Ectothiorhodospiraceae bacterium]
MTGPANPTVLVAPQDEVSLDDKYTLESGRVFMTGIQALVRLTLAQRRRDLAAGLDTAGYVTGYRGSPVGGLDQQFWRARPHLDAHHVRFQPGVNEDLAATACWGTQQVGLDDEPRYDGVFAIWYGKGPGVDRSGDPFKHANLAGTAPRGGVLALLGDDHTCESSTTAHQSEFAMVDAMIPVLNPAGVQEILDYGLLGIAMSRYAGCWVAMKCVHDTVEAAASVDVDPTRPQIRIPTDHLLPADGLNIRWPDTPLDQEARLHDHKLDAARAFCRANAIDAVVADSAQARVGVVTAGKSYLDVRQALEDLGIDDAAAARLGLRLYKVGMTWPLEPVGLARFAAGLEHVVVVEEKRPLIEGQVKELLYGRDDAPRVTGKRDASGAAQLPSTGRLDTNRIALVIGRALLEVTDDQTLAARVAEVEARIGAPLGPAPVIERRPYFCPGCPHNSSTRVPVGSHALAGIGCHYMAQWMDRSTARFTQMGGEGASWVGEAPFTRRGHVFQNIGDGTYYHSGLLAIRAAVASGVNITFKILYNDAVAMTGGQRVDGNLDVAAITRQVQAEGARRVVVVTDEPDKYPSDAGFAPGVTVHHRDDLDAVQRELRELEGTTALVYDQTCAAEKRRRRKRGTFPDPAVRAFINEAVCEGCGDCGEKSNCVAVVPKETAFGRKRAIDQSACNKDLSCVRGFCPSFVTVHGGGLRRPARATPATPELPGTPLPAPTLPSLDRPWGIVVTGVGGTGVITIGALIGMAAHLEGKGCSVLDMTGLAQKGGAVTSHLRIASDPAGISATRIAGGAADALLGCDLMVAAGRDALATVGAGRTRCVVNTHETMTGDFTRQPDLVFPGGALRAAIERRAGAGAVEAVDATRIATRLLGDSIATNLFMLGFAFQRGLVPVAAESIERAIVLNGVAVEMNRAAFEWGRRAATEPAAVERAATPAVAVALEVPSRQTLDDLVAHRASHLRAYQDDAYATRYRHLVERVRAAERERTPGGESLARAVAESYAKLLAYKDEYEVARLHCEPAFRAALEAQFEGEYRLELHLAPPLLARVDPRTGEPRKRAFGQWIFPVLRGLARLKRLRGTVLDPFGWTAERRTERALIGEYEVVVEELIARLAPESHALAVEIAGLPSEIRGFGPVKERAVTRYREHLRERVERLRRPSPASAAAA